MPYSIHWSLLGFIKYAISKIRANYLGSKAECPINWSIFFGYFFALELQGFK
jgi:hypothetical protein